MRSNALVVDTEFWYSPYLLKNYLPANCADQLPESIQPILELLRSNKIRATFAILGLVAKKHPALVKKIHDEGHEIASHAWSHKPLFELGKNAFEEEIIKSVNLLESITGERPIGFRAPSFSIDKSTKWAFEILEKYRFEYDASIFPIRTMLYGVPDAPRQIYKPSKEDITKNDPNGQIIEFPMTVLNMAINIPIAGGFYFRVLPLEFIKYGIRRVNQSMPAIFYFHPWETWQETPRLDLPAFPRFVTYYGIENSLKRVQELIKTVKFTSIKNVLEEYY